MARSPRLVLDENAVEMLLALPPAQRSHVLAALDQLRHHHPRDTEDFSHKDETGRHISVKAIRPVLISYWLDGAVDELRIVGMKIVQPWRR